MEERRHRQLSLDFESAPVAHAVPTTIILNRGAENTDVVVRPEPSEPCLMVERSFPGFNYGVGHNRTPYNVRPGRTVEKVTASSVGMSPSRFAAALTEGLKAVR